MYFLPQVPPLVLVETEEPLGVVNRSVTISFTIEEASPVVSLQNIQWRFNDSISLNNGTQSVQLGHVFSSDLLSLTINNVQHIDQGFYSLTATNEAGTNFSEVFLEVEGTVKLLRTSANKLNLSFFYFSCSLNNCSTRRCTTTRGK